MSAALLLEALALERSMAWGLVLVVGAYLNHRAMFLGHLLEQKIIISAGHIFQRRWW